MVSCRRYVMPVELKPQLRLEIAHVLFIDIVGYSKLLIDEQKELQQELNDIVRKTDQVREAEAEGKLMRLPTGDGMALVFSNYPEAPVECALEISKALQGHPEIKLRMGIHSGAVNSIADVNDRSNVAGAGINIAQRVMNCGDAGHILLSRHVAEDLAQYRRWQPHLHDLGDVEVKHGNRLHIFNLYTDELGNREAPEKFSGNAAEGAVSAARKSPVSRKYLFIGGAVLILATIAFGFLILRMVGIPQQREAVRSATEEEGRRRAASLPVPDKSIAVLPFENRSEDKANAYFADGIQDEILTNLARIADLKVISRTSVMPYKTGIARNLREIGLQLGVAHLLEGSVQRAANRVRVNAQLIDTRTAAHLWAQTYDRDLADVFAIQSEIAKAIADQLQARLSPNEKAAIEKPPTTDLAAFDLYSRAKALAFPATYGEQDVRQAIELLNQAVTRDPSFFEAYSQLVYLHAFAYSTGIDHTAGRMALADAALQAAVRLRPDAGETHLTRANYLYFGPRNYTGALAELETARRSLPNDPRIFELTGYILRRRGQQEEGLRNLEKALELDPRNDSIMTSIAGSYQYLRRYPEEAAIVDRMLTIIPNDPATKVGRTMLEFYWKADTRPLHQMIESILAERPGVISENFFANDWFVLALAERDPIAAERALVALGDNFPDNLCWGDEGIILSRSFGEGLLARMIKDEAKARTAFSKARAEQEKIVQAQPDHAPALCVLGLIDAALGRKEAALEEGRRAIELLPVEKDSMSGSAMIQYFAVIAAWTGEKDLALQQLEIGLRAPSPSVVVTYGALKLLPFWDPLRGEPRFEKIVAQLAPKSGDK